MGQRGEEWNHSRGQRSKEKTIERGGTARVGKYRKRFDIRIDGRRKKGFRVYHWTEYLMWQGGTAIKSQ